MEPAALDTRMELLLAALACFSERGFDGTSLRMISDRAKRPLSLLSHHFGNKEGLYLEVFRVIFEAKKQPMLEKPLEPRDAKEAIRMLREEIHGFYPESCPDAECTAFSEQASRLFLYEVRAPRPCLHDLFAHRMRGRTETIKNCILKLRPDLNGSEATFLGCAILGQVVGHGLLRGLNRVAWGEWTPPSSSFQASELLVELCLNGLLGAKT